MAMSPINSILDMIHSYNQKLKRLNINNGKQEIIWYLESQNLLSLEELYSNQHTLNKAIEDAIKYYYSLRKRNMPHQYILKSANFYGRDFYVDRRVLIPRPETEQIIAILKQYKRSFDSCLEIGIGSGCIALTLRLENIVKSIIGSDVSKDCLDVSKINQNRHQVNNMILLEHNILKDSFSKKFDLIVTNPPYITANEYNILPKHIKEFEPRAALTDDNDGLIFYRRFSNILHDILYCDGIFICELGSQHLINLIQQIFNNAGHTTTLHNDLNGDARFLEVSPHYS